MTRHIPTSFDQECGDTGTREWAKISLNLKWSGCSNNCRYCNEADNAAKRWKTKARQEWHQEGITATPPIRTYPKKKGTVMFPTQHDITLGNLEEFIRVAKLVLQSGNKLLITSKPRQTCIDRLLVELYPWVSQIMFRFTIGCVDPELAKFWEPGATSPAERISCLKSAYKSGFQTSVSIEPMLAGVMETTKVIDEVKPFTSDTIGIGKMNGVAPRVVMTEPEAHKAVEDIKDYQDDEAIIDLYRVYKKDPQVVWKDSIKTVIKKNYCEA